MSEHEVGGSFEVTLKPEGLPDAAVARMSLVKRFLGNLDATSTGEMLALRTSVPGSAGYVAIEQVVGTLDGRHGSFALQHSGLMDRGTPMLMVAVVPDSGTEALQGLSGSMTIEVADGQHRYTMRYRLPD